MDAGFRQKRCDNKDLGAEPVQEQDR